MSNALKYTKILEEVGFSRQQAEETVNMMFETIEYNLCTKNDLKNLEDRFSQKVDHKFELIGKEIKQLELRMTIKLGSLMVLFLGLSRVMDKLF